MKSLMQHHGLLARSAWLPLVLASGACSMDRSLGDISRHETDLVDDGSGVPVASTVDGAVAPALLPPAVTFAEGDQLWSFEPVVGTDLDADGYDDLVVGGYDVSTGIPAVHVRYGGPRPGDAGGTYTFAESGARLTLPASDLEGEPLYNSLYAVGDVDGDGYADLFVATGVCDGPEPDRGGYLIYGGPQRLNGLIDITSVSTHFSPPAGTGDGSACAYPIATAPGDLDGDGLSDLVLVYPGPLELVGPTGELPTEASGLPGVYVFYGRRERFGSRVPWTSADARLSSALSGDVVRETDVITVHAVGDLNADGGADLVINHSPGGRISRTPDEPAVMPPPEEILVPGGERLTGSIDLRELPIRRVGLFTQQGDKALGDLDGDGFDDIIARFGSDYMLFYGAPDLLDAPLDPARAAARIDTDHSGIPRPLGDLDGDGDAELGVSRHVPHRPWPETIDLAVVSGTRARLSGDIAFPEGSLAAARIYPGTPDADTRSVSFIAPVGDLDGDGAVDVLTRSAADDADAEAARYPMMLHLHYGNPVEPALSDVPR